jgi:hypothetical protein
MKKHLERSFIPGREVARRDHCLLFGAHRRSIDEPKAKRRFPCLLANARRNCLDDSGTK